MKQVRDTSAQVFHEDIEPTLHGRQLFVRQQLEAFIAEYSQAPTALELVRFVAATFPQRQVDVNTIRPRLFEMEQQGFVGHAAKRKCTISGKTSYTWEPTTPKPPQRPEPVPQRLPMGDLA